MTLYLSDLDGTLLSNDAKLKKRTCEMLNRLIEKGVMFSFATARGIKTSRPIMQELNLRLPVIVTNGCMIADFATGEILYKCVYSENEKSLARELVVKNGETPLVFSVIDGRERINYLKDDTKRNKKFLLERTNDERMRPCSNYDELFEGELFFMTIINPVSDIDELDSVFNYDNGFARNYQIDTYNKDELWYEIGNRNATKAKAALKLQQMTGADELVCFGDNMNDASMFEVSDRCYAVANAVDELKAIATDIIASNEAYGVPSFIEKDVTTFHKSDEFCEVIVKPDEERFERAVALAKARETVNIGTLNEKCVHSALKHYYADENCHEVKIGSFFADIVNERGIIEIQTANFGKLNKKLSAMLEFCHVTVVYPFEKRTTNHYIDEKTGEIFKKNSARTKNDLNDLFLELYRIKSFLTNPNFTLCIAELELDKYIYVKNRDSRRKMKGGYYKIPTKLQRELYFENPLDFSFFLPEGLPEEFTVKQFQSLQKSCQASLMLSVLECVGIVERFSKKGNAIIYRKTELFT